MMKLCVVIVVSLSLVPLALAQNQVTANGEKAESAGGQGAPVGKIQVIAKEASIERSFRETLDENAKLKKENTDLKGLVNRGSSKESVYTLTMKDLTNRLEALRRQNDDLKDSFRQEELRQYEDAKELQRRNMEVETKLNMYEAKSGKNSYRENMKKMEAENSGLKQEVRRAIPTMERLKQENGKMHYNLGNMYLKKGLYLKAAYEYDFAVRYLPGDADIAYNQGVLYDYYLNDPKKAIEYYEQHLEREPKSKYADLVKERISENRLIVKASE